MIVGARKIKQSLWSRNVMTFPLDNSNNDILRICEFQTDTWRLQESTVNVRMGLSSSEKRYFESIPNLLPWPLDLSAHPVQYIDYVPGSFILINELIDTTATVTALWLDKRTSLLCIKPWIWLVNCLWLCNGSVEICLGM